jgi:hypothetical protein
MMAYLFAMKVLLKDFGDHVQKASDQLKRASLLVVEAAGRPTIYLPSSQTKKEPMARRIAAEDKITQGPICTLRSLEPCWSYEIYKNRETKKLELQPRMRKCLHLYHYFIHPVFGFMSARIQPWFPFSIQICMNGREWLARQMDTIKLGYQRRENCFVWLEDIIQAQKLMDAQLTVAWPELLQQIARRLNPTHEQMFANFPVDYYWSVYQSEWATDIMFKNPAALAAIYPALIHHGITTFSCADVMRFLGHKVSPSGNVDSRFRGEIISDLKRRPEGVRLKHYVGQNSLKLYDKQGSVLRPECTINDPKSFKVYRTREGDPDGEKDWRTLRKGIADLHRRAEISQAANERYLEAMAQVADKKPLKEMAEELCKPASLAGRRVRALNPLSADDAKLLQSINRGEFCLGGFRNRDLRTLIFGGTTSKEEQNRQSSAITRKLRLLRAHGLIKKVTKTHRYMVTTKGRQAITALVTARETNTAELMKIAA